MDVLQGDSHLDHQNHNVVGQIGDLVDGFLFIVCLSCDDDLGAFLAHLLQDLVQALFKEVEIETLKKELRANGIPVRLPKEN